MKSSDRQLSSAPCADAPAIVQRILESAIARRASDVHLEPTSGGLDVRLRIDGLLETAEQLDSPTGRGVVTRLMVMAHLLTYRLDVPQEGRAAFSGDPAAQSIELRISIMPTTHGLRAAVRLPAELVQPRKLDELGLPQPVLAGLGDFARADSGMLILTGPAGSGKTTTIYALLEHIAGTNPGISIVALEDPVERDLAGITQIEIAPFGELTYDRALRSILRQDPQVLMLGEIRDGATASIAVQAALSGHRLISTMHAATPAGTVARLLEMGIEPYQITSSLFGVVSQRLLRRRTEDRYHGRAPVAMYAPMDDALRQTILRRPDAQEIARLQQHAGTTTLLDAAAALLAAGITDQAEVLRVLGTESQSR